MEYKLYSDAYFLNQAFLAGDIDAIDKVNLEFMELCENSTLHVIGERMQGTSVVYVGFDMNKVDINTRKALLSAINYSNVLVKFGKGESAQLNSIVPAGILYHDWDTPTPTIDLNKARAFIAAALDANEKGCVEPADWIALKESTDDSDWEGVTILSLDYSFNAGAEFPRDIGSYLKTDFAKIGVNLNVQGFNWDDYLTAFNSGEMEMYKLRWSADFNDPSNYIDNLARSESKSNRAHVNDSVLDDLIAQGLLETDLVKRESLYIQMQQRINEIAVFGYISTPNFRPIYNIGSQNNAQNALGKLYWYLWTFDAGVNYYKNNFGIIPSFNTLPLIAVSTVSLSILVYKKHHRATP